MRRIFSFSLPKYYDRTIVFAVIGLYFFGLLMIGSASIPADSNYIISLIIKQLIFFVIGYYGFTLLARIYDPKIMRPLVDKAFYVVFALMFVCLLFGEFQGAQAWIRIGTITIQPSEFLKVALILKMSYFLYDVQVARTLPDLKKAAIKQPAIYLGMSLFAILIQKDLGTLIITFLIMIFIYLNSPVKKLRFYQSWLFIILIGLFILIIISIPILSAAKILNAARLSRITILAEPLKYVYGSGYQLANGLMAIVSGGLFGVGFGQSMFKYGYIPEKTNDFILAIIMEELGLIGLLLIIFGYLLIIMRLVKYIRVLKDERGRTILVGAVGYLIIQFFVNVAGVTGLIPMTGVPLLFISAGGSSLWSIMFLLGLCESIISRFHKGEIT